MFCKNQLGSALPITLIVMMVLGVLGATLMVMSVAETRHVAIDENNLKAHYLARTGAHSVASFLIRNPDSIDDYLNSDSSAVSFGDGSFEVKVYGDINTAYIESVGMVNGAEQKVILTINRGAIFDFAMYGNSVSLGGNTTVSGDVVYGETENVTSGAIQEGFSLIHDPERTYPEVLFPSCYDLSLKSEIVMQGQYTSDSITDDTCTSRIEMNNNHHVLTVELGTEGNPKDLILRTGVFNVSGGIIRLVGYGRLLLYVDSEFVLGGNYETVDPGKAHTVVFIAPNATFKQSGTSNFEGLIYAPSVDFVTSGGGNASNLVGSVITRSVSGNGNVKVIYKEFDNDNLPIKIYRLGIWRYDL